MLSHAKAHDCDLEDFSCNFGTIRHTPDVLASFGTLQKVDLDLFCGCRQEPSITIVGFLASLPSLRSLSCYLTIFLRCAPEDTLLHTSLQAIDIAAPATLIWDLFRSCAFPSVIEAAIGYDTGSDRTFQSLDLTRHLAFEGLDTNCPNLQKLYLFDWTFQAGIRDFKHIGLLLNLPVQEFRFSGETHSFTPSDFQTMWRFWTDRQSFRIDAAGNQTSALSSLLAFSNQPHLNQLGLDIRPHFLLNEITKVPELIAARKSTQVAQCNPCTLYFAVSDDPEEIPVVTRADKNLLVELLLLAFPGLEFASQNSEE